MQDFSAALPFDKVRVIKCFRVASFS